MDDIAATVGEGLADILAAQPVDTETIRTGLGLTVEEFAEALGVSPRTVSRWKPGAAQRTTARGGAAREIRKLARLHFLVDDMLGERYGAQWLRVPNKGFRGQAPIDLILEGNADVVIAALEHLADGGPM